MQAMVAEMLNFPLSLMSAWMVGKVEAPAKANMIEAKALKDPSRVGGGKTISSSMSKLSITPWIMINAQARTVVISAPTAIGLYIK